ncbi:transcriptional regulator family: Fungal Specific TF [Aspergillus niger]|nr:transcriptional regulator family: Fungal Specific TF [Aspergillus niger]KAI2968128.1 transcriptional regulator family: Fungal Specific TF [Aspergillus niger]
MTDDYFNLGSYSRTVTTNSPDAQLWFNRGLVWSYSFNHEEASRCFIKASKADENCAMAYWGLAYARGPNYNKAWIRFDLADLATTITEMRPVLQRAQALAAQGASPAERAVIEALKARFPKDDDETKPENLDLHALDRAYAEAMRPVYEAYPEDPDIVALFVEALMCISPRALWNLDTGEPCGPHTTEARRVLEKAMTSLPGGSSNPAYCHLYIHLMEMAPYPEIALPAADRLLRLVPDGSHMLHMPSHIYVACGDYRAVIDSNNQAMVVDDKYFAREPGTILYIMYRAHNIYVKVYGAVISGNFAEAISGMKRLQEILTPELLSITSPPIANWAEGFLGAIAHVLIRFGRWDDILDLKLPEDKELFASTTAMIYYARGIALAVLNRVDEAQEERKKFEAAREKVPPSRLNSLPVREVDVLEIGSAMLKGEIEYRQGNFEEAFNHLRQATKLEDNLVYADPPPWMQPARHALGALLLEQGHVSEAQHVYEEDLGLSETLPRRKARLNNVWSLHGLYECQVRQGLHDKARYIRAQRDVALASADVPINASCFCRLSAVESTSACLGSTQGRTGPRYSQVQVHRDVGQVLSSSGDDSFSRNLSPLSFRGKQQRTRFFGRSHWATTLGMFPDFSAHLHEYYRNKQTPTNPGFTDYLTLRRLKHDLRGPDRRRQGGQVPPSKLKLVELLPERPLAEYLMQLYFSTFETTLRILHVPSFTSEWNAFWGRSASHIDGSLNSNKTDVFIAKLLMLMACASCFATNKTEPLTSAGLNPHSLVQRCHKWIEAVTTWLASMTSHAQMNLDVIQIKCLLLLAQQATAQEGDLVSMASGSLLREAMLMGLHRDPCNFPNVSPYWAELRKRLWLTIIELELQASLYSGIPLAISWDEFDCPLPSDIDDEDLTIDSPRLPPPRRSDTLTRTSFQIALAQTLETRMAISKIVNRVRLSATYDNEIMTLSERLTTGLAQAPPDLRDDTGTTTTAGGSPDNNSSTSSFRRSFFLFLHYRSLLALHRPFFLRVAETPDEPSNYSRRVCIQTSLALLSQLEHFSNHRPNNNHSSPPQPPPVDNNHFPPHILHLKGGLFRDDIFHAAATICFELRLQTKSQDRVIDPPLPGSNISKYMDQSVYYQRLALFESVENAIRYFEGKVRVEKRATKMFSILMILFMVVRSEMEGMQMDGGGVRDVLRVDDACPIASRRCREVLLENYQYQDEHIQEGESGGIQQLAYSSQTQGSETDTVGDACHHTNVLRPTGWDEAVGGDLRHLDFDWCFALDPLSPYPMNNWSDLDPLVM